MVAEKDTFAFFALSFPKSDFRVSYRIFASHIGFWRLISDFGVSYRIFTSQIRFTHHFSNSYFRASNWIVIIVFQFVCASNRCKAVLYLLMGVVLRPDVEPMSHELADLKDKTQCYSYGERRCEAGQERLCLLNLIVS